MQHVFIGSGAPSSTPTKLGQHYIDVVSKISYVSVGTGSSADWQVTKAPTIPVSSVFGRTGAIAAQSGDYTAAQVGADPTGTAASALAAHVAAANPHTQYLLASLLGAANGVCPLDATSKIASIYLPSFVDDVLEYANLAAFPGTGEAGKIYVAQDTNKTYRWSGSVYVEISASPGSTDAVPEGSTNLYFTNARAQAQALLAVLTGITFVDAAVVATDSILQAIGKLQAQINVWTELITSSDLTSVSNVTNTFVPQLQFPVVAGRKYRIEATIMFRTATTATGFALSMASPDTAGGTIAANVSMMTGADGVNSNYSGSITTLADMVISNTTPAANTDYIAKMEGTFVCSASGNLSPVFRSEVLGSTVTFRTASVILVREFV